MANYRITCVTKPDRNSPHEHITNVGGLDTDGKRWHETVANVVNFIDNKQHTFYTLEGGTKATVGTRISSSGRKFIQTHADGVWKDNLLALEPC